MPQTVGRDKRDRPGTQHHPQAPNATRPSIAASRSAEHTCGQTNLLSTAIAEGSDPSMWDRYDPRDSEDRDRGGSWDRPRGSRAGRSDRDDDRSLDPRDVFVREVDLPLGPERELVRDRDRTYEVNGTDGRVLATVGAFRVVSESDIERAFEGRASARESLKHLEAEGLLGRTSSGPDEGVAFLSNRGRDLLDANRWDREEPRWKGRQTFYAGIRRPRELAHDSRIYRAYLRAEERLRSHGGRVRRVVLDYELKREYQRFLQERNRGRKDGDGGLAARSTVSTREDVLVTRDGRESILGSVPSDQTLRRTKWVSPKPLSTRVLRRNKPQARSNRLPVHHLPKHASALSSLTRFVVTRRMIPVVLPTSHPPRGRPRLSECRRTPSKPQSGIAWRVSKDS